MQSAYGQHVGSSRCLKTALHVGVYILFVAQRECFQCAQLAWRKSHLPETLRQAVLPYAWVPPCLVMSDASPGIFRYVGCAYQSLHTYVVAVVETTQHASAPYGCSDQQGVTHPESGGPTGAIRSDV